MSRPTVAIIGAGPEALIAAYAADSAGAEVRIFDQWASPHVLAGVQYLTKPIKGFQGVRNCEARILRVGQSVLEFQAYDLRQTYRQLWHLYGAQVKVRNVVDSKAIELMFKGENDFDFIINTNDPRTFCDDGCFFNSHIVQILDKHPFSNSVIDFPYYCDDGTIIESSSPEVSWDQLSNIFGNRSVTWNDKRQPPFANIDRVEIAENTNCKCRPEITRLGKIGSWNKDFKIENIPSLVYNMLT